MRLTQYTDLGLRLLIYLASTPGQSASLGEIADAYGVSKAHLKKAAQAMAANGLLETRRGKSGGIKLIRDPATVVIGSVVRLLEPDMHLVECMRPNNECVITPVCRLRRVVHEVRAAALKAFDSYTLADIVGEPEQVAQLRELLDISP
ncbi:RrF2 family transcriptional regulator [Wenzhouxiangella limi]|uniref:Rrf2 family transcriptional regulator n=1 Tax=Wenzhouxiangella limi TaxID=2707351 RepID=A0A845V4W4_9GAMM|nr:Rrf2 family transcriptional regulator [Wenzhouxiangella limi]NDY96226.1 Rrf2 family transcriptional regulator [Wenzhouxiangella limi]